jgi:hypothetical protein
MHQPAPDNDWQSDFVMRVVASFDRATGGDLVREAGLDPNAIGRSAWDGNFALLCHSNNAILTYANRFALALWEMDWPTMLVTPSQQTAPQGEDRETRAALLDEVARNGFIRNYTGRRVSRTGKLFLIENATVWTLFDEVGHDKKGARFGTGAFFTSVTRLG